MKTEASEKIMENNFHVGNPRRQKDLDLKNVFKYAKYLPWDLKGLIRSYKVMEFERFNVSMYHSAWENTLQNWPGKKLWSE